MLQAALRASCDQPLHADPGVVRGRTVSVRAEREREEREREEDAERAEEGRDLQDDEEEARPVLEHLDLLRLEEL